MLIEIIISVSLNTEHFFLNSIWCSSYIWCYWLLHPRDCQCNWLLWHILFLDIFFLHSACSLWAHFSALFSFFTLRNSPEHHAWSSSFFTLWSITTWCHSQFWLQYYLHIIEIHIKMWTSNLNQSIKFESLLNTLYTHCCAHLKSYQELPYF